MTRRFPPAAERLWSRVDRADPTGCWVFQGGKSGGYGYLRGDDGERVRAHRLAYQVEVGPIPDGLHLDHLCRNKACVNPDHLEPVSPRENVMRGNSLGAIAGRTNQCIRGHEFTPDNTYWRRNGTARTCRSCRQERRLARQEKGLAA